MRIVIWHGYLLGGTGSNVYSRSLARTFSRQGHDVVVVCQEPHPDRYDVGGARVVRPTLPGPLPVFVLDAYEDADARLLADTTPVERDAFVEANAAAVRAELPADVLLVNHVLLGGPVGAATGAPFVVKAHGSELEFAIRGNADLAAWAGVALSRASAVLAGSEHIVDVIEQVVPGGPFPTVVVPPGVDIDALRPRRRAEALATLLEECQADSANPGNADERAPDEGNAERLAAFLDGDVPTVLYVGKLSREKGVALLLEAVAGLGVRTVVAGFGPARAALEATARGDVLFTGALEHRHLAHLWALADVAVTPSVFPEAFGMVAAEAASCGCPPLVADHSGLAEIAAAVAAAYPPRLQHLTAFATGDARDLRAKLQELLGLEAATRAALRAAARATAEQRWSWTAVADRILDVAAAGVRR